ncbi:MAG: hypothetical protein QF680_02535 [Acidobacteriota bacterium]|jgi:hypothetical protein|nr:hypothetical protein [Acidobacteriota bacterium]
MSEPTVVDARLDKLEQDNRRLKLTVGALLLVMATAPLVGAVMPEQIPDVIQARAFQVIGENSNVRASINAGGIAYVGDNGKVRSSMTDYGVESFDENGTRRAAMTVVGIIYGDENGTSRAVMAANGIGYYDENRRLVWRAPER